ncbi:MAG: transcription termination factor Rho [Acidobacteria bacterium]|nr:transcription termination factor Rho [Acidobacteriota bacterium]
MAVKSNSPDRSDLESKSREDLHAIVKLTGAEVSARASKATLIETIMGATSRDATTGGATQDAGAGAGAIPRSTRVVRSRRTVATPEDFDSLVNEFSADVTTPASAPTTLGSSSRAQEATASAGEGHGSTRRAPSEPESRGASGSNGVAPAAAPAPTSETTHDAPHPRQGVQSRERQPRDFGNEPGGRNNRRNRRNRNASGNASGNGRERFSEAMPNADQPYNGDLVEIDGLLDLRDDGYGFLRTRGFHASPNDVYVSINMVRRYHLRKGDVITGGYRPAASNEKYPALLRVDTVAGFDPEVARLRPRFEDLTPLFPDEKLKLASNEGKSELTPRIVDLLAPIGKGQRGLIVSPPKAGKTTIMKQIAQSIEVNNPEVHLMVLLVDERPEEVTDMRRSVNGEVIASTFDRPAEEHTHVAELCIERAKRLVEQGRDVVIILDGITRLARAYNLAAPATGRIMSGGVDSGALYPPKKFFGSARNIEEGGSLTILASALVETGSKMDEVIFEEFKGTGNMELKLDRRLAERRLFPAIDVNGSSTRHEELLFDRDVLPQVWKLRRVLNGLASEGREAAGLELLIDKLKTTRSNDEFLSEIARGPAPTS